MAKILFSEEGWKDYLYFQQIDKKILKKINSLIKSIEREGALFGEGHPELLKGEMSGNYSRHINDKHRLVYRKINDDIIEIISCVGHYSDK